MKHHDRSPSLVRSSILSLILCLVITWWHRLAGIVPLDENIILGRVRHAQTAIVICITGRTVIQSKCMCCILELLVHTDICCISQLTHNRPYSYEWAKRAQQQIGWYCFSSPTNICEYTLIHVFVMLVEQPCSDNPSGWLGAAMQLGKWLLLLCNWKIFRGRDLNFFVFRWPLRRCDVLLTNLC